MEHLTEAEPHVISEAKLVFRVLCMAILGCKLGCEERLSFESSTGGSTRKN
jgi:hypothetical protein